MWHCGVVSVGRAFLVSSWRARWVVGDGGSPQHNGLSLLLMSLLGGWMKECGVNHIYVCRRCFERNWSYSGRLDCGLVGVVGRGSLVMTRDRYWFLRAFDFFPPAEILILSPCAIVISLIYLCGLLFLLRLAGGFVPVPDSRDFYL